MSLSKSSYKSTTGTCEASASEVYIESQFLSPSPLFCSIIHRSPFPSVLGPRTGFGPRSRIEVVYSQDHSVEVLSSFLFFSV